MVSALWLDLPLPLQSLLVLLSSAWTRVVPNAREEEEDVARGGEMAAENKPEGKREITRLLFFISQFYQR